MSISIYTNCYHQYKNPLLFLSLVDSTNLFAGSLIVDSKSMVLTDTGLGEFHCYLFHVEVMSIE